MNILWIEDFGKVGSGIPAMVSSIFKSTIPNLIIEQDIHDLKKKPLLLLELCKEAHPFHEIHLCRHYHDFKLFLDRIDIKQDIDTILLDLNLSEGVNKNLEVPDNYQHDKGGLYIYNHLIYLGFSADKIVILTGEAGKGGTLESFEKACKDTLMSHIPQSFDKNENNENGYEKLRVWLKEQESISYSTLRRGIIEACAFLKRNLDKIQFNEFLKEKKEPDELKENIRDYLETLEKFLPLVEPENKSRYYKLFVRTLSHEWEDNANPKNLKGDVQREKLNVAFGWIMKTVRNGMAHNSLTQDFDESSVAFLFIVAMRSMFKLNKNALEKYEELLCSLFSSCSEIDMKKKITEKSIPLIENYAKAKEMFLKLPKFEEKDNKDKLEFNDMIHRLLHNSKIDINEINKNLFQIFWFALVEIKDTKSNEKAVEATDISKNDILTHTSMIEVNYTHKIQKEACYQIFDSKLYESLSNQNSFLFHFSRHIYNHSF